MSAYWVLTVLGAASWVLLAWSLIALIAIARGGHLTHPIVRIFGATLCALAVGTLDVTWFGGLSGTPATPGGLIPDFFAQYLLDRFNGVGVTLWMLTAIAIGTIVVDQPSSTIQDPEKHKTLANDELKNLQKM